LDALLRSEVALKVAHPDRDPERALTRLRREVEAARESLSSHLVRIYDVGRSAEEIYLTMEYLSGGSLRDRLRKEKRLQIEEVIGIAEAVLEGLAALHATGTIHRDVTPGNILFSEDGVVKLGDFGLVRREGRDETKLTREGGVVGTAGYLSPEQVQSRTIGPWSDLYSLGVVCFEMLAGRLPQEAASELGRRLAPLQRAPNVRRFREKIPRWLARIVARFLEVHPADRYRSAEAVLRDLRRHHAPGSPRLRRRLLRPAVVALLALLRLASSWSAHRDRPFLTWYLLGTGHRRDRYPW